MTDADYENMSAFSCGVKTLDDFFHFEVKECVKRHYLSAYSVFIASGKIIAAFTLMNDALMIGSQSSYPAINIGHLGTLEKYQGLGIGSMIIDLVADTYEKHRQSGCQFITVDALNNDKTIKFYYFSR